MSTKIVPDLLPLAQPISSLREDPDNARAHDDRSIQVIADSLARFGQRKPVVVRASDMTITAGNGTFLAAKKLGWKELAAVVIDERLEDATAYAIADNKTAEVSSWEEEALKNALKLVGDYDETLLTSVGFEVDELTEFMDSYVSTQGDTSDFADLDDTPEIVDTPNEPKEKAIENDELRFKHFRLKMTNSQSVRMEQVIQSYIDEHSDTAGLVEHILDSLE